MPILTTEERLGSRIAERYRLEAVLGSGGMGVLFAGLDEATGRRVAVKMIKPAYAEETGRVARFLRETRIASTLVHPSIAAVLDSGTDETGTLFLVMELLEGCSLEQELARRGVLAFREAVAIVLPIGRALSAAHASGVIHRDLKPSNIFLCRSADESIVPKLLDFGIAKNPANDFETQTGVLVGTPGYMAPEQARDGHCGAFTDVWGLGAVLHRCVMGHPPHGVASVPEMLAKLVTEPVPPVLLDGVRKADTAALDRALERDPQRRYQTMQAFVRALEATSAPGDRPRSGDDAPELFTGTLEFPQPWVELSTARGYPPARRSPRLALAVQAIAVLGLVALVVALLLQARRGTGVAAERRAEPPRAHLPAPSLEKEAAPALLPPHPEEIDVAALSPRASEPSAPPPRTARKHAPKRPTDGAEQPAAPVAPAEPPASAQVDYQRQAGVPVITEW